MNEIRNFFFSDACVRDIQLLIKKKIYAKSNNTYMIDDQSPRALKNIMDGIYSKNASNSNTTDIEIIFRELEQLKELTSNEAVEIIYPNLIQHIHYLQTKDRNTVLDLSRPICTNNKGEKSVKFMTASI